MQTGPCLPTFSIQWIGLIWSVSNSEISPVTFTYAIFTFRVRLICRCCGVIRNMELSVPAVTACRRGCHCVVPRTKTNVKHCNPIATRASQATWMYLHWLESIGSDCATVCLVDNCFVFKDNTFLSALPIYSKSPYTGYYLPLQYVATRVVDLKNNAWLMKKSKRNWKKVILYTLIVLKERKQPKYIQKNADFFMSNELFQMSYCNTVQISWRLFC